MENESTISKLEELINEQEGQADSIEEYNKQLDKANARIDKGQYRTQEEVEKMAREW